MHDKWVPFSKSGGVIVTMCYIESNISQLSPNSIGRMTHLTTEDLERVHLQPFVQVISDTDDEGPELASLELSARRLPVSGTCD